MKPTNLEGNECCFVFNYYRLSPFDCAVIGKFLSSVLTNLKGVIPTSLHALNCQIGDYGLEQLLKPAISTAHSLPCPTTNIKHSNPVQLNLNVNLITHKSVEKLKCVLTLKGNVFTDLHLTGNFGNSMTNKYIVLKYLIECLSHKQCSVCHLFVVSCGFTEQHMYHLVLLVHSHSLRDLNISGNSLSTGFALFCSVLKMNKCLTGLDLLFITLSDDDILLLADALHEHSKISKLNLAKSNSFRSNIFYQFLQEVFCTSSRSCLSGVWVDDSQYRPAMKQLESYQAHRRQNGLPLVHLKIYNNERINFPLVMAETSAQLNMDKSLLTGE